MRSWLIRCRIATPLALLLLLLPLSCCDPSNMSATTATNARGVKRIVTAHRQREGGGFIVRRPVGGEVSFVDPFLMLDHMGPQEYGPGEAVGAPDHPHRGFETVTYILQGGFHHKDSQGNEGNLEPGWVQWMTAGSGVIHSEMPTEKVLREGGVMEGFQLWVNLPAKDKMCRPRYQDTPPERIPVVHSEDKSVSVKVIAGECMGTPATIETRSPMHYLDVHLSPGASFTHPVPAAFNGFVYVYRGHGSAGSDAKPLREGQMAIMGDGVDFTMRAAPDAECRMLLIAGEPLREPVARYGPFVMNTQEEIAEAFSDYRRGVFGRIEGEEERMATTDSARRAQKSRGKWQEEL